MQISLIVIVVLHVLAAVFWAGSTFALVRLRATDHAGRLFWPQMGSAALAIVTGSLLWGRLDGGPFGTPQILLSIGALSALLAVPVQAVFVGGARHRIAAPGAAGEAARNRIAIAEGVASVLLVITLVLMTAVRFVS